MYFVWDMYEDNVYHWNICSEIYILFVPCSLVTEILKIANHFDRSFQWIVNYSLRSLYSHCSSLTDLHDKYGLQ